MCRGEWTPPPQMLARGRRSPFPPVLYWSHPCYGVAENQSPLETDSLPPLCPAFHLINPNQTCQCGPWQGAGLSAPLHVTASPTCPLPLRGPLALLLPCGSVPCPAHQAATVKAEARGPPEGAVRWPLSPSPNYASSPRDLPSCRVPGELMLAPPCNSCV